jgi:two-component system, NtrC family, nitrogen regulation response regulator GlnG
MSMTIKKRLNKSVKDDFFLSQRGQVFRYVIDDVERSLIEKALELSDGNQISAAQILGINRNTIRSKIRRFNIHLLKFKK